MPADKHTPGPWKACRSHEHYNGTYFDIDPEDAAAYAARPFTHIEGPNEVTVVGAHDLFEFKDADAHLMAAAPDLLAALDRLLKSATKFANTAGANEDSGIEASMRVARTAIRKARGESEVA